MTYHFEPGYFALGFALMWAYQRLRPYIRRIKDRQAVRSSPPTTDEGDHMNREELRKAVARAICDTDTLAPAPDAPVLVKMKQMSAWEARLPIADAVIALCMEAAARSVCKPCREGFKIHSNEWHFIKFVDGEEAKTYCFATPIRALASQPVGDPPQP